MLKLSVYALAALATVAGVRAADENSAFWDAYIQNVDSFPSAAPSPAPSGKFLLC